MQGPKIRNPPCSRVTPFPAHGSSTYNGKRNREKGRWCDGAGRALCARHRQGTLAANDGVYHKTNVFFCVHSKDYTELQCHRVSVEVECGVRVLGYIWLLEIPSGQVALVWCISSS